MPHQCTACGRQFADGSKEMLSGCPDCGGTKFQFMPAGGAPAAEEPPEPPGGSSGAVAETVGAATTKLRDFVSDDPTPPGADRSDAPRGGVDGPASQQQLSDDATHQQPSGSATPDADTEAAASEADVAPGSSPEDGAQSAARSEMVSPDELPGGGADAASTTGENAAVDGTGERVDGEPEGRVVDTPSEESPELSELREELNEQFEGIRICERGQYELNLMELYEREETIIALQENGRYVIDPPESWHGNE